MTEEERFRAGCSIGAGIGGLPGIESESIVLHEKGPSRVSPHFVHGRLINLISGQVSIKYGLMGPNHAVVTACSTGAHSIGDAARMIAMDDRSEEHTSELQSLMRNSYAVFCLKKKNT